MLFDKVLSQKFNTDIWRATATTSEDYSAEAIFLFSTSGIPNNRVNTDNLTLCDHNNLCGGERVFGLSCLEIGGSCSTLSIPETTLKWIKMKIFIL